MNKIYHFAQTNFRKRKRFGIKKRDLSRHMLVFGDKQSGKNKLLEAIALSALSFNEKLVIIDLSGKMKGFAKNLMQSKQNMLHALEISKYSLDPFLIEGKDKQDFAEPVQLAIARLLEIDDSQEIELLKLSCKLALKASKSSINTVFDIILDESERERVLSEVKDRALEKFWLDTFEDMQGFEKHRVRDKFATLYAQFRAKALVHKFFSNQNPLLLSNADFIYLDLSLLVDDNEREFLLNMLFVNFAILRRNLSGTTIVLHEFDTKLQEFVHNALNKASKNNLNFVFSTFDSAVLKFLSKSVGSIVSFKSSDPEALEWLSQYFHPTFDARDINTLDAKEMYLRLLIDGELSDPFSAELLPRAHAELKSANEHLEPVLPGSNTKLSDVLKNYQNSAS